MNTIIFKFLYAFFIVALVTTPQNTNAEEAKETEGANTNGCQPPNPDTTTFCFFSLNNPEEKSEFEERFKDSAGELPPNVEVKEFYGSGNEGESVEDRYRAMLAKSECDSVVISGHHLGYFAGKQSIGDNEEWKLDLDFMEELSCEPGCANWSSNVKSLS